MTAVSKDGDERFGIRLRSETGINYTHLINQSVTEPSGKAIVLPKKVLESDPTNTRKSSLHYERWTVEWTSDLFTVILFWRRRCMEPGRKSLIISHFDLRHFNAVSDLSCEKFFLCISGVWLFCLSALTRWEYPSAVLIYCQNWEEKCWRYVIIDSKGSRSLRAIWRSLLKVEFFSFFRSLL